MSEILSHEDLKRKLLSETAKISWDELQQFYARGSVVWVSSGLDLLETAMQFANDQSTVLKPLLAEQLIAAPTKSQARQWYESKTYLWSVVVAPFVLVQELQ